MGLLKDIAPIAGSAIDAISSFAGGLFNANQARKNRAFQERMYERQVQDNIKFWEMQNAYDLPSAQLQRLKDAGLSPLLAYSSGPMQNVATSAPEAAHAPSGAQAQANFGTTFGTAMQQAALMNAQLRNLDADTETKLQEALLKAEETVKTREESGRIKTEKDFNIASFQLRLEAQRAQNDLNRALATEPPARVAKMRKEIEVADKNIEYMENEMWNKTRMTDQEIAESKNRIENAVKLTAKQCENLDADTRLKYAEAVTQTIMQRYYASQSAYYDELSETERQVRDSKVKKYTADLFKAIQEGNTASLEKAIKEYEYSLLPELGSFGHKWNKFYNTYVEPISGVLGSGIIAGAVLAK